LIAYILAALALVFVFWPREYSGRIIVAVMALMWIWMGLVYHILHFSSINKPAYIFGAAFMLQGFLFIVFGVVRPGLSFSFKPGLYHYTGAFLMVYALVIYPLIGYALGHGYPKSPSFGVAPCPATIFTFGVLLMASVPVPKSLLIIPFLWSLLGFNAVIFLGILEDVMLLVAGVLGSVLIVMRSRVG
jgi:hypothetical protein